MPPEPPMVQAQAPQDVVPFPPFRTPNWHATCIHISATNTPSGRFPRPAPHVPSPVPLTHPRGPAAPPAAGLFSFLLTSQRELPGVMGPAVGELMAAIEAQGITATGPHFAHYLSTDSGLFDFEVGVPVSAPVA